MHIDLAISGHMTPRLPIKVDFKDSAKNEQVAKERTVSVFHETSVKMDVRTHRWRRLFESGVITDEWRKEKSEGWTRTSGKTRERGRCEVNQCKTPEGRR